MMKKISNNFQCINISNETYTGKELSPKGLGYSAVAYDIGFKKTGANGEMWIVQIKNGKKVWFKESGMPKVSHEEPIITNVIPQIIEDVKESDESVETVEPVVITSKKEEVKPKTDFQLFYNHYSNILKDENIEKKLNKKPKTIQEETYAEWNRLKKNKVELNELLLLIKNK